MMRMEGCVGSVPAGRAALAVVVGAHDEQRVFDGDDDDQRPEDQ